MKIHVSDPERIGELIAYLKRCGCSARVAGRVVLEADPPTRPQVEPAYLRMELDAYLRVWREMNPEVRVELLQPPDSAEPAAQRL
jgi:hypothetical protein